MAIGPYYWDGTHIPTQNGAPVWITQAQFEDCCCVEPCNCCGEGETPARFTVSFSGVNACPDLDECEQLIYDYFVANSPYVCSGLPPYGSSCTWEFRVDIPGSLGTCNETEYTNLRVRVQCAWGSWSLLVYTAIGAAKYLFLATAIDMDCVDGGQADNGYADTDCDDTKIGYGGAATITAGP